MISQCLAQHLISPFFHESFLPGPVHPANGRMTPLTLFVWLFLGVFRIPCSAYRAEGGLEHALQAEAVSAIQDAPEKDAVARSNDASGQCASSEEQAIERLAELWGYTDLSIISKITKCKKEKVNQIVKLGTGFDVTCHNGSIKTLGIKKKSNATILDLSTAICGLPNLTDVVLDRSNVSGRLEDLKDWKADGLERLHMRGCRVEGELRDLQIFTKLKALKLSGPSIRGWLQDLGPSIWNQIVFLDLGNTSVTGDVSGGKSLRGLWLQYTDVTGDIMRTLEGSPKLEYLHLPGTKVGGPLRDPGDDRGQKLKELVLYNSSVTFKIKAQGQAPFPKLFPELTKLDVTGCPLSMDVWEFLKPLARSSYHLAELKAANCHLRGEVKGIHAAENWPMKWQINVLDLSYNNITSLSGTSRACWLDVSHNHNLTKIDHTYFEKTTLLDLRDTAYDASDKEAEAWKFLEEEDDVNETWRCKGVRPKKAQENGISRGRVLVTPSKFASDRLCSCTKSDLVLLKNQNCCGCGEGLAQMMTNTSVNFTECLACFGPGCASLACYNESKQCSHGYEGPLCAACAQDFRSNGFARCEKCTDVERESRVPLICLVTILFLLLLACSLWFWVWRPPDKNTATERGLRFLELLEQILLIVTYSQLLMAILSLQRRTLSSDVGEGSVQKFIKDFIMVDVTWLLDAISVQCMLGYKFGRNLEVFVSALFLPMLVMVALTLGFCRWHSPFYGLKYAIVTTSVAFQVTVTQTWGNLFWCETLSARGWALGDASFLSQRPFITCSEAIHEDPLRYWLLLALVINGAIIPGSLCLLGMYITRRIRGVQALSASIIPVIQCDSNQDSVTLHFATVQVAVEKILSKENLGIHADFPSQVIWLYAAAYVACVAESMGSKQLEVVEAQFSPKPGGRKSVDVLKVKLTKDAQFKELSNRSQDISLRDAQTEAQKLGKRLLYRAMAKHMTQGSMRPIWIGTRNSFERFADKDPLLCEGLWKFFLLSVTKMCLGSEGVIQMTWVATAMAASAFGIRIAKPFGSQSRNDLATLCFGALFFTSITSALLCLDTGAIGVINIAEDKFKVFVRGLTLLPTLVVFLFFLHLQLMPGDIMLQASWLQTTMKERLRVDEEGKMIEKGDQDDQDDQDKKEMKMGESTREKTCPFVVPLETSEWNVAWCPKWCSTMVNRYRGLVTATWHRRRSSALFHDE
eukprot:s448_g36.t1